MNRPLNIIAEEIIDDWRPKPNPAANPYIRAMLKLDSLDGFYGYDNATSIVLYFLANAGTWRGETARRIKAELNKMLADRAKGG